MTIKIAYDDMTFCELESLPKNMAFTTSTGIRVEMCWRQMPGQHVLVPYNGSIYAAQLSFETGVGPLVVNLPARPSYLGSVFKKLGQRLQAMASSNGGKQSPKLVLFLFLCFVVFVWFLAL